MFHASKRAGGPMEAIALTLDVHRSLLLPQVGILKLQSVNGF
jgi:hypothetical protein